MVMVSSFLLFIVSFSLCFGQGYAVNTRSLRHKEKKLHSPKTQLKVTPQMQHNSRQLEAKTLSIEQVDGAIVKAKSLLSLIHGRYEYDTPRGKLFITMQSNMKEKDFALLKLIFLKKLTSENAKYKMVFGGSSVTAGHDSLFHDSHPKVLESRMRPIFETLGVQFEVDNIAQGANDCSPSNLCYDAMAGEGGDFYLWEQSFNCGRDVRFMEMVVRLAARNEASVYIMSSGGVDTRTCAKSTEEKPLHSDSNWEPSQPIQLSDAQVVQFKKDLIAVNKLAESMGTNAANLMKKSYSEGPSSSGINVWFGYPVTLCEDVKPKPKACDVPNLMDGCVGLKFLSREASVYAQGHGAAHHPSRAMHMMRAELIAWSYTIALLEAMFTIRQELVAKASLTALYAGYSTALTSLSGPVKKAAHCGGDPFYCEQPYNCFTEYSPKYTDKFTLKELQMKTNIPNKWKFIVMNIEKGHTDRIELKDKEMRNHFATREGPKAGELFLRVKIVSTKVNRALICWEGIEKKGPMLRLEYRFDLNVGEEAMSPNFTYVPKMNRTVWESKVDLHPCMSLNNLPVGVHVLGLESKGGHVGVSHVITWGQ